jgi:hypothetical protein
MRDYLWEAVLTPNVWGNSVAVCAPQSKTINSCRKLDERQAIEKQILNVCHPERSPSDIGARAKSRDPENAWSAYVVSRRSHEMKMNYVV